MSIEDNDTPLRNPPVIVPDTERAGTGQIVVTALGAIFIIAFVLFGINSQREHGSEPQQTASTQTAPDQAEAAAGGDQQQPAQPRNAGDSNAAGTTGQGGAEPKSAQ